MENFEQSEQIILLEIARLALQDAEFFDIVVENTDITDEEMCSLRNKLQEYLNPSVA